MLSNRSASTTLRAGDSTGSKVSEDVCEPLLVWCPVPAISRVSDRHVCPLSTPAPHGGGVLQTGSSVTVNYQAAATVGSVCTCGGPGNVVTTGASSVRIDYMSAARVGSQTAHGGSVVGGEHTVQLP